MTNPKRPRDTNQLAKLVADIATGSVSDVDPDSKKDAAAVARGRKGGVKGGAKRMATLSEEERKALATRAAKARWSKAETNKASAKP